MQFLNYSYSLIRLLSKNNIVDCKHTLDSCFAKCKIESTVLCAQWRLAGRRMTHLYDPYLFESGWSCGGSTAAEGAVDYPAEIRPQRIPGLPHATTKQTLNRGRCGSRGNRTILSFFSVFLDHAWNERRGNISFFFCSATSTASTLPPLFLFYRPLADMLPRGVTDRFVPKSAEISWRIFRVTRY